MLGGGYVLGGGHVDPQVDDPQALPLEHHFDEVLADVVPVALDGAEHDGAAHLAAAFREQGLEQLKSRVHRARGDHDLGDIDLVRLEFLPDAPHARKQAAVQDFPGGKALRDRAGNRFLDGGRAPLLQEPADFIQKLGQPIFPPQMPKTGADSDFPLQQSYPTLALISSGWAQTGARRFWMAGGPGISSPGRSREGEGTGLSNIVNLV